jgi:hypothetical protein
VEFSIVLVVLVLFGGILVSEYRPDVVLFVLPEMLAWTPLPVGIGCSDFSSGNMALFINFF